MNLPCGLVEDMLPLYYDGVCSEESAVLVEAHLGHCDSCSRKLTMLRQELELPTQRADDIKPLEKLQRSWRKNKQSYLIRGICLALSVMIVLLLVTLGVWHFAYGRYFFQMADKMDRVGTGVAFGGTAQYVKETEDYDYSLVMPVIFSDSGFARVTDRTGITVLIYPERGGSYRFCWYIMDQNDRIWQVRLKPDMTPDFGTLPPPTTENSEQRRVSELVAEKKTDIEGMLSAIYTLWEISLVPEALR